MSDEVRLMLVLEFMLPFFAIIGWAAFFSKCLKTAISPLFFTTTALIGLLEFLFAITNTLRSGSLFLLVSGFLLFFYLLFQLKQAKKRDKVSRDTLISIGVFVIFSGLIVLFAWGVKFRSIDDYSFWGLISRYLFLFGKLPVNDQMISPQFLTYTPGMGCFHYLFYFAVQQYSQYTGYVAQGVVLLSALMVFFDPNDRRVSLLKIAIAYVGLSIGFGTIFARMEVDGYVAAYVLSLSWLIFTRPKHLGFLIIFPLLFLSLIKEIGLLFAFMCLVSFLFIRITPRSVLNKFTIGVLSFLGLLSIKFLWVTHCAHYDFHGFSSGITSSNLLSALNPFNDYYHSAQFLFIKGFLFGSFGHVLAVPNIVIYIGLFILWRSLSLQMNPEDYTRASTLKWMYLGMGLIYLVMLYLLQAIVFGVGHAQTHLLDFQRYYNMLLIPFTIFTVLLYVQEHSRYDSTAFFRIIIMTIACLFFVTGKIERTRHSYLAETIYPLVDQVKNSLPKNKKWILCLKNAPEPTYNIVLPLTYFFMPNRVVLFRQDALLACDFIMEWANGSTIINQRQK